MQKKDLAEIKKQFKFENCNLHLENVVTAYVTQDSRCVGSCKENFNALEEDIKAYYFSAAKKILTGKLGEKIHEFEFPKNTQEIQRRMVSMKESFDEDSISTFVDQIVSNCKYGVDYLITIIHGEYNCPSLKTKKEDDDTVYVPYRFVIGFVCLAEKSPSAVCFDIPNQSLILESLTNKEINYNKPLDGFLFPAYTQGQADVNHVIYYTKKAKEPNMKFINNVLGCKLALTCDKEKAAFSLIIGSLIGDKTNLKTLEQVYACLNEYYISELSKDDSVEPKIDKKGLVKLLSRAGVNVDENILYDLYSEFVGEEDLNVLSLLPTSNLKVGNKDVKVTISSEELKNLKFVMNEKGKQCLVVEVEDIVMVDGIEISPDNGEDDEK